MAAGDRAFFQISTLDPRLKGHEVLVASSNNKAVENISRELPAAKAIGRANELTYFKSLSDRMHGTGENEESTVDPESIQTWGMIAAVLGNSKNRSAFRKSFWWHDEYSFAFT